VARAQCLGKSRYVLAPQEVHVWHLCVDQLADPDLLTELASLLTPEELARQYRYAHERDRRQFFLARVLARTVLGSYLKRPCTSLRFTTTPYGKPLLLETDGQAAVRFNLTHSHGVIACAVSPTHEVGIDVEDERRNLAYLELADRYFARPESAHLRGLEGEEQRAAFFAIWTLKEAFVKAIGQGLTYPLDIFAFELERDRLRAFRRLTDDVPRDWHFYQFHLGPTHRGAVAVQANTDCPVRLKLIDWGSVFLSNSAAALAASQGPYCHG
jgi:4'-phosphopantetheinyl transferase